LLNRLVRGVRKNAWYSPRAARANRRRTPTRSFRPHLEALETLQLLSTFTVVLPTDSGGPAGQKVTATSGDLRFCIEQADAAHAALTDTIVFSPFVFATPQTIVLKSANGPLVVNDSHPLAILGPIANTVTVSGGDAIEVLDIAGGAVNISHLAISHGNAHSNKSTSGQGGGIFDSGQLTLSNCTLDHDVAGPSAGGLFVNVGGSATLLNCSFNHDTAADSTPVVDGDGGAIFAEGTLTMTNCILSNCLAGGVGGGAIFINVNQTATLTNCIFSNDSAPVEDAGGIFANDLSTVTLTNCTFSNDTASNGGGGICTDGRATVFVRGCTFSNDTTVFGGGGGIANVQGSTVFVTQSTFSNDSKSAFVNQGTAFITACTFNNDSGISGGGLENDGTATVVNCTFTNDTATSASSLDGGGAIANVNILLGTRLNVINCTIANNAALNGSSGGGILNQPGAALNLINTIVAENTATGVGPDVAGTVTTADHNLIGNGSGMAIAFNLGGNLIGTSLHPIDPRLGPLQNNGGPTQTLALLPDSPAIGHANNAKAPATDQRGITRIDTPLEVTDIGAFEF
jgi:predicted outer membrane repeat protein